MLNTRASHLLKHYLSRGDLFSTEAARESMLSARRHTGVGRGCTAAERRACTHPPMVSMHRPQPGLCWTPTLGTPHTCRHLWHSPTGHQSCRRHQTDCGSLLARQIRYGTLLFASAWLGMGQQKAECGHTMGAYKSVQYTACTECIVCLNGVSEGPLYGAQPSDVREADASLFTCRH